MAMKLADLTDLLDRKGLRYFESSSRSEALAMFQQPFGVHRVVLRLEQDGAFFQLRTVDNPHCPRGHRALRAVLEVIGELNYRLRMVKFGWDPEDGEIVAYADVWLEDSQLTFKQLDRMLGSFLLTVDLGRHRLEETIESGIDPGDADPKEIAEKIQERLGKDPMTELAKKLEEEKKKVVKL